VIYESSNFAIQFAMEFIEGISWYIKPVYIIVCPPAGISKPLAHAMAFLEESGTTPFRFFTLSARIPKTFPVGNGIS
jgi:hypothetical protein